jgi:hypothetical protein
MKLNDGSFIVSNYFLCEKATKQGIFLTKNKKMGSSSK